MSFENWSVSLTRRSEGVPIDAQQIARKLQVEAKAREDAQRDELAASTGPTPTEREIDMFHERLAQGSAESYTTQLDAQQAKQIEKRLAFEHPFEDTVHDLEHQAATHKTEFTITAAELQAEQEVRQIDYNVFRDAAGLSRQPIEPTSAALHWAFVIAFVMVESAANAPFFAAGNMLGLAGGLSVAACIAALNVFLAAQAGVILRYVNHVSWRVKALAVGFGMCFGAFLIAFHLGVAHWRNALAGLILNVKPGEAGRAALAALNQMPFSLLTIEAWALVLIGGTFALIALVAGYRGKDPYPGYSEVAARLRAAAAALRRHKDGYIIGLNAIFEGDPRRGGHPSAVERFKQIRQHALAAMADYRASVAETSRLMLQYAAVLSQIEASRTYCICRYRSVYRAIRQNAPAHFAKPIKPLESAQVLDLAKYTPQPIDEPVLHAALAKQMAEAIEQARKVQREYLEGAPALFAELGLEREEASVAAVLPGHPVLTVVPASPTPASALPTGEGTAVATDAVAGAHAGKPPIKDRNPQPPYRTWIRRLAPRPERT